MQRSKVLIIFMLVYCGCDTSLLVKGIVVEGEQKSILVKSNAYEIDTSKRISDVQFSLYPHISPSNIYKISHARIFKSDSLGRFDYNATIGPGKYYAALISSKEGYLADTLIFEYKPLNPESLIVVLKKLK